MRLRRARVVAAWVLLAGSLAGWPLSALTLARHEPQFVLALSWLAITIASAELLTASQVHEEQGRNGGTNPQPEGHDDDRADPGSADPGPDAAGPDH